MTKRNRDKKMNQSDKKQTTKNKKAPWNLLAFGVGAAVLIGALIWGPSLRNAGATEIVVYKSPTCGCCRDWVDHLRDEGFKVTTHNSNNMDQIKAEHGVKTKLQSCHTALVEGYVVEGHVPAADIKRLLQEKPTVAGLAAPGMPMGSPGMEGPYKDPYDVLAFEKSGATKVYARH